MRRFAGRKDRAMKRKTYPYNYDTFVRSMAVAGLHFPHGPRPGDAAPDFELPDLHGGTFRLSAHRGKPILLTFGAITCPMAAGARPVLLQLWNDFRDRVEILTVYNREPHPGEKYPHHSSLEQKMQHARDWLAQDPMPWTVLVDTLDGEVDRQYGPLPNSAYLIGRSGRVAFRALWAGQESLLREDIEQLLEREAAGEDPVVLGEQEKLGIPPLSGASEFDYAIARGGRKAEADFRRACGGALYALHKTASHVESVIHGDRHSHTRRRAAALPK
jgi:AhpC/TSA family protein